MYNDKLYGIILCYDGVNFSSYCYGKGGKKVYTTTDIEKAERRREKLIAEVGHCFSNPEIHYRVVELTHKEI